MKSSKMAVEKETPNGIGLGVDAAGGPVIDPTANVVALTDAAHKRQDDLRSASERYQDMQMAHMKEVMTLRSEYSRQLSEAEAKRIDAIRAVDVNAVAVASERQAAAATVLANQVASSADALRTLVSTTAAAMAEQQRIQLGQITDRLTLVERSQYEGRGKAGLAEPMLAELVGEMKSLRESRSNAGGKTEGSQAVWGFILLGVTLLTMAGGMVFSLLKI